MTTEFDRIASTFRGLQNVMPEYELLRIRTSSIRPVTAERGREKSLSLARLRSIEEGFGPFRDDVGAPAEQCRAVPPEQRSEVG